jgi:hypothetical protein
MQISISTSVSLLEIYFSPKEKKNTNKNLIRRIQFGLWDGSIESGTAEWSRGPIDVSEIFPII